MSGESEKTLRDTFDEAKVCGPALEQARAHGVETGSVLAVLGRSRCHHTKTRDCSARNGEENCRPVVDVHGR